MKKYLVKIEGTSPYMQHRMNEAELKKNEKKSGSIIKKNTSSEAIMAEAFAYRNAAGKYYIPNEHLRYCFINGSKWVKGKIGGIKRNLSYVVAPTWTIEESEIILPDNYEIDSRSVPNKTGDRVMLYRPKWFPWSARFTLCIDIDEMTDEDIIQIIEYGGSKCGIGAFRAQSKGLFGKFKLINCELISIK
jgi:hypothetical protein